MMQIENDYDKEVYNGDIGYIDDVNPDDGELIGALMAGPSPTGLANSTRWCRPMPQPFVEPGSEYPAFVIPVMTALPDVAAKPALHRCHPRQETGRHLGQKKAVAIAVRNVSGDGESKLQEWLNSVSAFGCCGSPRLNCLGDFCRK